MPQATVASRSAKKRDTRHTVALAPRLAHQVEKYAKAADCSMSKAIATLVRAGIESQDQRKREFLEKLRANLANTDPAQKDRMVDEFSALFTGR